MFVKGSLEVKIDAPVEKVLDDMFESLGFTDRMYVASGAIYEDQDFGYHGSGDWRPVRRFSDPRSVEKFILLLRLRASFKNFPMTEKCGYKEMPIGTEFKPEIAAWVTNGWEDWVK